MNFTTVQFIVCPSVARWYQHKAMWLAFANSAFILTENEVHG